MSSHKLSHLKISQFCDLEDQRRDELCLQLAENLHDLGASEFSRELRAGDSHFIIHVVRFEKSSMLN
jgi:hypothetical protein